jgi:hypothetical protein
MAPSGRQQKKLSEILLFLRHGRTRVQRAASTLKKGINSAILQGFHTEESGGGVVRV